MSTSSTQHPILARLISSLVYGLLCSVIAYCCISAIAGKAGYFAYRDLQKQKSQIQKALTVLETENERKAALITAYTNDTSEVARFASELGYIQENELLIVLPEEWKIDSNAHSPSINLPVRMTDSTGLPDSVIRMMSIVTGLCTFFALELLHIKPSSQQAQKLQFEQKTTTS